VLPDFVCIGAMKAGTTSLYGYLNEHPQIEMPAVKEIDYFVEELNWPRGQDWYEGHFAHVPEGSLTGDISPNYSKHPHFGGVPERMARVVPEARLIYVMRDPVARMRSHWMHAVDAGNVREPLGKELLGNRYYRECSSYGMQLERFLEHFPRERVLLLTAEELRTERHRTLKRVFEFLGVAGDPPVATAERAQHSSDDKRVPRRGLLPGRKLRPAETKLSEAEEHKLRELMRPDMERLARYMSAPFDAWGILR
jgi:Sulfotransferase domain